MRVLNPLVLFCGGIAWILEIPLFILSEANIISANRRAIIVNGKTFSLLSSIVTLATLAGTVIGIVKEWDQFQKTVAGWLR